MPSFHENAALKLPEAGNYVNTNASFLYKAFEQSEEELVVSKINHKLLLQCGAEFKIQFFAGDAVHNIADDVLDSLADCYAQVFNESWGESWTRESALEE